MKQHKKWMVILGGICLIAALFLGGYYWKQQKENRRWSLVYIPKTVDGTNDFWTSLISGARMAAKEYNVSLEVVAPEQEQDVEGQNRILAEVITQAPDALLISPSSFTASTELLEEAKAKGIPVVFIDSYMEEDIQEFTVATDNLEVGRKLGEFAQELLDEDAQIAVVGHVQGVSTAVEREQGFREGLGEKEKDIVEVVFCDSMYEKSYNLTMELMEKYPELKMIAGLNEYSSVGAARAVKAANAEERIKVIGVDSSQEAVQLMEQGVFQGIVLQKAFKMGYVGVRETVHMLQGKKIEKYIDSGSELVTPENMYTSENEKLLFPFKSISQTENGE